MTKPLLQVADLSVSYLRRGARLEVISGIDFSVGRGESFGLVGESGCGKSTAALALVRYLPRNGRVDGGSVIFDGIDVLGLSERELREIRGTRIAMVYQDPQSALNPALRVGEQIGEVFRFKKHLSRSESEERSVEMLELVALPDPGRILRRYPHQLSGGQQQRVVIAMALAAGPDLLILDEPTTGLDASVEAEICDLLLRLRSEIDAATLFISHNLGLVTRLCDTVGVLYAGRLVESGPAQDVFLDPRHPYTAGLVRCVPSIGLRKTRARLQPIAGALPPLGEDLPGCHYAPRCPIARDSCLDAEPALEAIDDGRASRCYFPREPLPENAPVSGNGRVPGDQPTQLLTIHALTKRYRDVVACDGVTIDLWPGEILGVVGESGSGKTTLARCVAGLTQADSGEIQLAGGSLPRKVERRSIETLRSVQMVFQNADSTLNPSHSVRYALARAVKKLRGERSVSELTRLVRLEPRHLELRSGELSGGMKQRVAIGRAFAGKPALVICDEPVSALDVSVQAAILNLLIDLAQQEDVAYIFISHDLGIVQYLADRVAVMYAAHVVETGTVDDVTSAPQHPYTEALFSAFTGLDPAGHRTRIVLKGPAPNLADLPQGCHFCTRCPRRLGEICDTVAPPWHEAASGHHIRCHIPPAELLRLQLAESAIPKEGAERD